MPRFIWFAPIGVLVALLAVWAFRQGWIAATISETDVIETWTAHYVQEQSGGRRSDCSARPGGRQDVWILVTCVHADGRRFDYPADKYGRLVPAADIPPAPQEPQT